MSRRAFEPAVGTQVIVVLLVLVVILTLVVETVVVEALAVEVFVALGATEIVVLLVTVKPLGVEYRVSVLVLPSLSVMVVGFGVKVEITDIVVVALTVVVLPATYKLVSIRIDEEKQQEIRKSGEDAIWQVRSSQASQMHLSGI